VAIKKLQQSVLGVIQGHVLSNRTRNLAIPNRSHSASYIQSFWLNTTVEIIAYRWHWLFWLCTLYAV